MKTIPSVVVLLLLWTASASAQIALVPPAPTIEMRVKTCDVVLRAVPPTGLVLQNLGAQFALDGVKVGARVTRITDGVYQVTKANVAAGEHAATVVWSGRANGITVTLPPSSERVRACQGADLGVTSYAKLLEALVKTLPAEQAGHFGAYVGRIVYQAEALDVAQHARRLTGAAVSTLALESELNAFAPIWRAYAQPPIAAASMQGVVGAVPPSDPRRQITRVLARLFAQVVLIEWEK